jgi:hypothetical protein
MLQKWSYANYSVKILKIYTGRKGQYFPTGRFDLAPPPATGTPLGEKKNSIASPHRVY